MSEYNLGGDTEEDLVQITGIPIKGDAAEKEEHKMVIALKHWFYDLQVLEQLTRDKDPPLQTVRPNQIALDRYLLEDAYKRGFGNGLSMPKEGSDGVEDLPGMVHTRHGVWCE